MDKTINAEKIKSIRLMILKILNAEHPGMVDFNVLRGCLANFGYPILMKDLESYMDYLAEKDFILTHRTPDIGCAKIKADGIDILNGMKTDPGIGMEGW